MAFFIPLNCVTLSQFHSITSLVLFTKSNKIWNIFVYMTASAYHLVSEEVENRVFRRNRIFRHIFMYKQPSLIK